MSKRVISGGSLGPPPRPTAMALPLPPEPPSRLPLAFPVRNTSVSRVVLLAMLALAPAAVALDASRPLADFGRTVWQDELPQLSVHAIAQTSDGYLWIATQQGLARFDGSHFAVFNARNTEALRRSVIWALLGPRSGGLWIGSMPGGLARLANRSFRAFGNENGLSSSHVYVVHEDAQGRLWVGTTEGLAVLKGTRFEHVAAVGRVPVRALASRGNEGLWIATEGAGLMHLVGEQLQRFGAEQGLAGQRLRALALDPAGRVFVGSDEGQLEQLDGGRLRPVSGFGDPSRAPVRALRFDNAGSLWIGTFGAGLLRLSQGRFERLDSRGGMPSDAVSTVFEDRVGQLWVGTIGGGLVRLKEVPATTLSERHGLPTTLARGVVEDRDGSIWAGTQDGLAHVVGERVERIYTQADGLPHTAVYGLALDEAGTLWVGTRAGLARRSGRRFEPVVAQETPHDIARAILPTSSGLLVGGEGGLWTYATGAWRSLITPAELGRRPIFSLEADREGNVWIGTDGAGLLRRTPTGELRSYHTRDGLPSDIVRCAYDDGQGTLWICTDAGLGLLRDGRFSVVDTRNGLPDDVVLRLIDVGDGSFWLTSPHGPYRVAKRTLLLAAGGQGQVFALSLGTADGLRTSECNGDFQPAGLRARDGRLWIPTVKGLAVLDPQRVRPANEDAPLLIEEVLADDRPAERGPGGDLRLAPGTRRIELHFAALELSSPERVRLRYRLEGFEDGWREERDRRQASYTNVPPGRYDFQVQSLGGDGNWREPGARLELTLEPHLWQRPWFVPTTAASALLVAFGLGLWAHRRRVQGLRLRESELGRLVHERTQALERANDELRRLAQLDGLTEIANHRRFKEVLEHECRRSRRQREPVSLLLLDIDCFKDFNDLYGHPAGDLGLKRIATVLRQTVRRPFDLVARYGGEEFAMLLPDTELAGAMAVAERIRIEAQALAIPHAASPVAGHVTVSIGVATVTPDSDSAPARLVEAADRALYRAKRRGRNQVAAAEDDATLAEAPPAAN